MLGLLSNPAFVPLAVIGASLAGSGHCVSMCGGLIASSTQDRGDLARYHLGRLAGYVAVGALAGFLGENILREAHLGVLPWIATGAIAGSLVFSGLRIWQGKGMHFRFLPSRLLSKLYLDSRGSAFRTGLLSAFLPCGWLHTFVLGSVATRSPVLGALFLFSFWLGTLPALSAAPWVIRRFFKPMSQRLPRLSASLLIVAGIACIGVKMLPLLEPQNENGERQIMTCHSP